MWWRWSQECFWVHAMPKKEPLELIWNKMHTCMDYILKKKLKPGKCERRVPSLWTPGPAILEKWLVISSYWLSPMCSESQLCSKAFSPVAIIWPRFTSSTPSCNSQASLPNSLAHYIYSSLCSCLCDFFHKPHLSPSCPETKFMILQVLFLNDI